MPRGDDFVGNVVNLAARIVDLAGAGEVLVSEALLDSAGDLSDLDVHVHELGPVFVKGVPIRSRCTGSRRRSRVPFGDLRAGWCLSPAATAASAWRSPRLRAKPAPTSRSGNQPGQERRGRSRAHGNRSPGFQRIADVGDEDAVAGALRATVDALGAVDCCFANVGVGGFSPFLEMTLDEWRRVMRVNLDGVFLTLREVPRHMVERGEGGSLVAISSVSAVDGAPAMEHYAAAKAGVLSLMRALAVELARGTASGATRCCRVGRDRHERGHLEERRQARRRHDPAYAGATLGRAVRHGRGRVFLADPSYLFHTGDQLVVDGGYTVF